MSTKGGKKVEVKLLENRKVRQVTFSKRRKGLFKKAMQLSLLCDAQVSLIVKSSLGKLYRYESHTESIKVDDAHLETFLTNDDYNRVFGTADEDRSDDEQTRSAPASRGGVKKKMTPSASPVMNQKSGAGGRHGGRVQQPPQPSPGYSNTAPGSGELLQMAGGSPSFQRHMAQTHHGVQQVYPVMHTYYHDGMGQEQIASHGQAGAASSPAVAQYDVSSQYAPGMMTVQQQRAVRRTASRPYPEQQSGSAGTSPSYMVHYPSGQPQGYVHVAIPQQNQQIPPDIQAQQQQQQQQPKSEPQLNMYGNGSSGIQAQISPQFLYHLQIPQQQAQVQIQTQQQNSAGSVSLTPTASPPVPRRNSNQTHGLSHSHVHGAPDTVILPHSHTPPPYQGIVDAVGTMNMNVSTSAGAGGGVDALVAAIAIDQQDAANEGEGEGNGGDMMS